MSLNIKNERVHALAREAARVTGQSQTRTIEEALRLLLAKYEVDPAQTDRQQRLDLLRDLSLQWDPEAAGSAPGAVSEVEELYDQQTGLPA